MTAIAGRDYFLEVLDTEGSVIRQAEEGRLRVSYGGVGRAWIPDRQPGDVSLRVVDREGIVLAVAPLTDDELELA